MKKGKNQTNSDKLWQSTQYANLIRYVPSGVYYARIRIRGKIRRRSLETKTLSVARMRLADRTKEWREAAEVGVNGDGEKLTFKEAAQTFLAGVEKRTHLHADHKKYLKPKSWLYYRQRYKALFKSWPELDRLRVNAISPSDCEEWSESLCTEMSPTAYNHTVQMLRKIFEIGIEKGAIYKNPAGACETVAESPKKLSLPEPHQFEQFVEVIRTSGSGFAKPCSELVQFLAYGGFRIGEAVHITWGDVDFDRERIHVKGDPVTGTKNREERYVPMIGDMKDLLTRIREGRADEPAETPIMRVRECQKAMNTAAKKVGMKRITHHDLRHLFATRCIESGVDIPTVSRWLGHKDGGALAMRTYGHLRDDHSNEMAKRVSFSSKGRGENIIPVPKKKTA